VASKQLIIKDLKTEQLGFENLTTAERDLILNPEAGTTIFNSDTNSINYYDGTNWLIAGGLNVIPVSGSISGVSGSHYLADTSGGAFTITLPAGSIGARLKFSDASETWNEFPLTIAPAAGEAIDGYSVDETLVCDVLRGWVDLTWDNTNSKWILDSFIGTNAWQTQVHTTIALANDNTSIVQNFSLYDAQELIGHVSVDADTDYRASVRVIVVKNGAGTYEVSLAEVSGDSINASPIVAFSMSGADLQATLPDFTGFVSANIKYYLVRPITTADYPLSIDGSQITSGTVSPDRIALSTANAPGLKPETRLCRAYRTVNITSGITSGAEYVIPFNAVNFDIGNCFNVSNGRYTPNIAGIYRVSWLIGMSTSVLNAGRYYLTGLRKNGADVALGSGVEHTTTGFFNSARMGSSTLIEMNGTTDYFEVWGRLHVTSGEPRVMGDLSAGQTYVTFELIHKD
jgi:hypothetical protein